MKQPESEPLAERYGDLPKETRRMLEDLRLDEVAFLQNLIRMVMSFGTTGRAFAYVAGAILGLVIGLPMLIAALSAPVGAMMGRIAVSAFGLITNRLSLSLSL